MTYETMQTRLAAHLIVSGLKATLPKAIQDDIEYVVERSNGRLQGELIAVPDGLQAELTKQYGRSPDDLWLIPFGFYRWDVDYLTCQGAYTNAAVIEQLRQALIATAGTKITSLEAARRQAVNDADGYFAHEVLSITERFEPSRRTDGESVSVGYTLHIVYGTTVAETLVEESRIWQREIETKGHLEDVVGALEAAFPDRLLEFDGKGHTITFTTKRHLLEYLNAVGRTSARNDDLRRWEETDITELIEGAEALEA